MSWTTVFQGSIPIALAGFGWLIRRGLIKYERALVAAERARANAETLRREMVEKELIQLRETVASVQKTASHTTQNQAELKKFLGEWSKKLTAEVGKSLKLGREDVDKLTGVLGEMVSFLDLIKDNNGTAVKEIANDHDSILHGSLECLRARARSGRHRTFGSDFRQEPELEIKRNRPLDRLAARLERP